MSVGMPQYCFLNPCNIQCFGAKSLESPNGCESLHVPWVNSRYLGKIVCVFSADRPFRVDTFITPLAHKRGSS